MKTKITNLSDLHNRQAIVTISRLAQKAKQLGVCVVVEAIHQGEPRWIIVTPDGSPMGTGGAPMGWTTACELAHGISQAKGWGEYFVEMGDVVGRPVREA